MKHLSVGSGKTTLYVEKEEPKRKTQKGDRYYWSTHPGDKPVYHTCRKCTEGNNIEKGYLESGNSPPADYRKCGKCDMLENSGNCETGVPTPAR